MNAHGGGATDSSAATLPANNLDVIQVMIDIYADRLEGLRTQCATSAMLTQQEIRSLETKLVRMFSELLVAKARLSERVPANGLPQTTGSELKQWLRVVGLSPESLSVCLTRLATLEQLLDQSDEGLKQLLCNNPSYREEEVRRLTKAMRNLRKCKEFLSTGSDGDLGGDGTASASSSATSTSDSREQLTEHLFWDSWDRHSHHHHRGSVGNIGITASPRTNRLISKQVTKQQQQQQQQNSSRQSPFNDNTGSKSTASNVATTLDDMSSMQGSTLTLTLTPSPPNSPFTPTSAGGGSGGGSMTFNTIGSGGGGSLNGTPQRGKLAGTPPPMKKHQTLLSSAQPLTPTHSYVVTAAAAENFAATIAAAAALSKSKSNESQFHDSNTFSAASSPPSLIGGGAGAPHTGVMGNNSYASTISRSRLHTDPSPDSYSSSASSECFVAVAGTVNANANIENMNNNNNNNNNHNNNPHHQQHSLQVPRSPCTPIVTLGMGHTIPHHFTNVFKIMSTCDLCQKQMFFGLKCKECKYRCHKDCQPQVPPSCGLPREFVDEFKKTLKDQQVGGCFSTLSSHQTPPIVNTSPQLNAAGIGGKNRGGVRRNKSGASTMTTSYAHHPHHPDSSSPGSSCNSSSPSSPALFNLQQQQHAQHAANIGGVGSGGIVYMSGGGGGGGVGGGNIMSSSGGGSSSTSSNMLSTPSSFHKQTTSQFNFPDVTITTTGGSNCGGQSGGSGGGGATQMLLSSQTSDSGTGGDFLGSPVDYDSPLVVVSSSHMTTSAIATSNNSEQQQQQMQPPASSSLSSSSAMSNSITISSSNCNSVSIASSSVAAAVTASMVNTDTGTFYPRKLSSAGVDKRITFSAGAASAAVNDLSDTHKSNDSDKTVSLSGSTSASTDSDRTPVRLDSTEDGDSGQWPRQNSLSLKEWDIPYGDLRLLEEIGRGRFGTVHRAHWHGEVAVKQLKEDYLEDEHMLEIFKLEVANFKNTRHENLVLFMGACMNPPYLAIVTKLCKGNTLYTYIHMRRDKFTINKTTLVAQQISQGMGYLHARGIFHKDLRTKNIFLENGKVIITDFGLFSSTKLLYCNDVGLGVPNSWLCYLAPELMRALLPHKPSGEILPFSMASDVYSFGTVWYELLCGEFPFKWQPPESIIWQVGRGMKQTLANLQTSRDVKDILMLCWSFQADDRPDFPKLLTLLERLPKKRLARSPSHPVQLSRSAESVF